MTPTIETPSDTPRTDALARDILKRNIPSSAATEMWNLARQLERELSLQAPTRTKVEILGHDGKVVSARCILSGCQDFSAISGNIVQVLPLAPQPATITTTTHAAPQERSAGNGPTSLDGVPPAVAAPTPRTDAHCKDIGGDDGLCYAEFARQLERELDEMERDRDEYRTVWRQADKAAHDADRDAARYRFLQRTSCGNATGGRGSDEECFLSLKVEEMDSLIDAHLKDEARRSGNPLIDGNHK